MSLQKSQSHQSKSKKSSQNFDNSRDIGEISYIGESANRSFQYETPISSSNLANDPRY